MRSLLLLLPLAMIVGCGDAPARLSDEDVDRIAERTTEKVMKKLADQGSDDLAYRIHQKMRDLDRVAVATPPPASVAPSTPPPASIEAPAPNAMMAGMPSLGTVTPAVAASVAAGAPSAAAPAPSTGPAIVQLDERKWTQGDLEAMAHSRGIALDTSNGRDFAEELANFELAAREASAAGVDREPEFKRRAGAASDEYIAHALYREKMSAMEAVTEDLLRERYQRSLGLFTTRENAQVEEFWAPNADDAKKLIAELKPGVDLAGAQKAGKVPATVRAGSGRTTARPGMYPPNVFAALRTMKPGDFSEPIQSDAGFLVLRLLSYTPETSVPFEQAREKLKAQVEQERLQDALKAVEEEAKRVIPVKLHPERFTSTDSLAELAEVGDEKVLRQDILRELSSLPDPYRQRFSTKEGFADLVDRVAQKVLFSTYAHKNADFMRRHAAALEQIEKQERVRLFLEREIGKRVTIGDADVKAYYERHASAWKAAEVHLRNISFRSGTAEEKKAAPERANKVMERLKAGEPFDKVAKEMSDDQETKARGGDMGWLTTEQLPPELRPLVAQLSPGTNTPVPVQSMGAFHLIRMEGKRDARPLEEVRASIESALRGEKQRDVFVQLVTEWKKHHEMKLDLDKLKLNPPAQLPGNQPRPTIQIVPGGAK